MSTEPEAPEGAAKVIAEQRGRLTIAIIMEEGRPCLAAVLAKHMAATVKILQLLDKEMHGRITSKWYIAGFDIQSNGVAYQLMGFPKDLIPKITNVFHDGPDLVNGPAVDKDHA